MNCTQCSQDFILDEEEIQQYKKFDVEPLNICFECQHKQRLSFRNERVLYNRKCDATGESIVSIYAPDSAYKVYKSDYWYGDQWDPLEYGRDFDFNETFFEQYKKLHYEVPRVPLVNLKGENSDYCNMCVGNKNCYLVFGGDFNEDCMYCTLNMHNKDCLDIDYSNHNELAYMMDNSMKCYDCQFVWDSNNCTNCYFSSDCIGCNECIFCFNLKNKSYCIDNQQYSKEEYFEKKKEILNGSYETQQKNWSKFLEKRSKRITKYAHILACENCTGDYIKNSKNCKESYDISDSEDMVHVIFGAKAKDCFNTCLIGDNTEIATNCIAVLGTTDARHSYFVLEGSNVEYSEQIVNGQDVFGCNGLHKKQYCILNKQYSKQEYASLREKIVEHMKKTGEWGKFFPKELSCFGYNLSTAIRYYPLSKDQALKEGFSWIEEDPKEYQAQTYQIPNNIQDVPDTIVDEILACISCKKNYKIIPQELTFYKKKNIPVPRKCAECRQSERMSLRNRPKLYDRNCMNCDTSLQSTYQPNSPEKIFCEPCYLKKI